MWVDLLFLLVLGCTVLRFLHLFCLSEHILSLAKPLSLSHSQLIFVLLCADCMCVFVLTHVMTDMPTDVYYTGIEMWKPHWYLQCVKSCVSTVVLVVWLAQVECHCHPQGRARPPYPLATWCVWSDTLWMWGEWWVSCFSGKSPGHCCQRTILECFLHVWVHLQHNAVLYIPAPLSSP